METELVAFPSTSGSEVIVAARPRAGESGLKRVARGDGVVSVASETFEAALSRAKPIARAVITALEGIDDLESISVEFGLSLSAETGAFIASATAEANFSVSLTWNRSKVGSRDQRDASRT